jgi:hypothetical protein
VAAPKAPVFLEHVEPASSRPCLNSLIRVENQGHYQRSVMDKRETKNPFLSRVRNGCEREWIFTLTNTSGYGWMRERIMDYPWISVEILGFFLNF